MGISRDLDPEIIEFEILTRLPVKSLLRFRSVCKSWKLFISKNQSFIKSHLALNPNYDSLIVEVEDSYYHHNIIGSSNGLVCFYNRYTDSDEIGIWNPATKLCKLISPWKPSEKRLDSGCFGFGYDIVADDYKVIYTRATDGEALDGWVYSFKADCWRTISPSNFIFRGVFLDYRRSTVVNGSPYWLTSHEKKLLVISFDVQLELFLLLPQLCLVNKESGGRNLILTNLRDSVAVMVYHKWRPFGIDVYVLCDGIWSKTVIPPFISKQPKCPDLLQCFRDGDILFMGDDLQFYCFNPQTHTIKSLGKRRSYYYNCLSYTESLIFIQGMLPWHQERHGISFVTKEAKITNQYILKSS